MGRRNPPADTTDALAGAAQESARGKAEGDGGRSRTVGPAVPEIAGADLRGYVLRRLFALSDLVALGCALIATYGVKVLVGRDPVIDDVWVVALLVPLWVPIGVVSGLYHADNVGRSLVVTTADEIGPVFRTATIWSWCVLVARAAVHPGWLELLPSLALWALGIPLVLGLRLVARRVARHRRWYLQTAILAGRQRDRARVLARLERHPEWGLRVVEQVDLPQGLSPRGVDPPDAADGLPDGRNGDHAAAADAPPSTVVGLATSMDASRVIFATSPETLEDGVVRDLMQAGIHVDVVAGDSDVLSPAAHMTSLEGLPVLSLSPGPPPRSWLMFKRALDLLIAVPALVLTLPLLAYCAVRIKLDSPGPVLFGQERAGRDRRRFRFLKLRTMSADAEQRRPEVAALNIHAGSGGSGMFKAVNDPRVTKIGTWLRRYSLDELPQLWNVVRGDMSLVGPRPLPVAEDASVATRYELRYQVRPGMTGRWQVLGRSNIPFEDMLKLDYGYVLNWSIAEDLKLLLQTAAAVVKGRGAY